MVESYIHPPLPPYLGGWALASLAFTSPIVLSLLLVIMRLILAINSANASVDSAKLKLASSCLGLEQAASVAVSFPHYLADNMNEVTASGAEALIHGLSTVLDMSVLAVEQILVFVIDMYRSMYLCFVELVVRGSMALAIGATEEFTEFFNETVASLRNQLQDAVNGANTALGSAIEVINRVPGVDIDAPSLDPNLALLDNVAIPDNFLRSLQSFNESLPTLDELKERMNSVIEIPFEALRQEIATNLGNVTIERGTFPIPEKESLAFCQDLDYAFVDDVGRSLVKVAQYGIIIIAAIIVLYISAMVFLERRWFTDLAEYAERSRRTWASDIGSHQTYAGRTVSESFHRADLDRVISGPTLMGFLGNSRNPLLRTWLPRLCDRIPFLRKSPRVRSNATWFISYITYTPALLLLAVALLGILSIEIQLAALEPTEKSAQEQVNSGLSSFKADILSQINNATAEQSLVYANESNVALLTVQNGINQDMFEWVNSTTINLNSTINEFYDGLTGAITTTFRDTVFATAALGVVNCLIGTKIDSISRALTWLHDNAHVTLPKVSDNVFMSSPDKSDELVSSLDGSDPGDVSASGSLVETLVGQYRSALQKERGVFYAMLGLYGLVVFFGLIGLFWHEKLGPRLNKKKLHTELKDFKLDKPVIGDREPAGVQHSSKKLGGFMASPLARLREKKSRGGAAQSNTWPASMRADLRRADARPRESQTFTPPPAYPPSRITDWRQQPSTVSLLGALGLANDNTSRQSLASAQRSSAAMASTESDKAAEAYPPLQGNMNPRMPASYLYGCPHAADGSPARDSRPVSSINPFQDAFR